MTAKTLVIVITALVIGFGSGFIARPLILPVAVPAGGGMAIASTDMSAAPRGKPYFESNLEEARQVIEQCRAGTARGGECASAETAVIEAEGKERFNSFMGR